MNRWDYRVYIQTSAGAWTYDDGNGPIATLPNGLLQTSSSSQVLNDAGNSGWELVAGVALASGSAGYVMKRPAALIS